MNKELLGKHFPKEAIRQRQGQGGKRYDYVSSSDVINRLIEATENSYRWTVTRLDWVSDAKASYWLCIGYLEIEGLGTRYGVGTALPATEDAPKSAETDALKRAAVKFGVALNLYEDHPAEETAHPAQAQRPQIRPQQAAGAAHTAQSTNKGEARKQALFLKWEEYFNVTHLCEVTGCLIQEGSEERETLWKTFGTLTSAQLDQAEAAIGGKVAGVA